MLFRLAPLALALVPSLATADAITVLTVGKVAVFKEGRGVVRVGRDPALARAPAPTCPTPSTVELSAYPVATQRVAVTTRVELDCSKWRAKRGGGVYPGPGGPGGPRAGRVGRFGARRQGLIRT